MKTQKLGLLLLFAAAFFLTACGSGASDSSAASNEAEADEAAASEESSGEGAAGIAQAQSEMKKAMEEMQKQMGGDGEAKEPVNFRTLKELLPASINGMDRTSHTGEKAGAMGFKMSTAEAKYEADDRRLELKIIDFAGTGMALMGMAAWASMEVDRETDDGYERTTTIKGHKAFEEYDSKQKRGQVSVIVKDRFIVTAEGRNVTDKELRNALDAVGIDGLSGLQ